MINCEQEKMLKLARSGGVWRELHSQVMWPHVSTRAPGEPPLPLPTPTPALLPASSLWPCSCVVPTIGGVDIKGFTHPAWWAGQGVAGRAKVVAGQVRQVR